MNERKKEAITTVLITLVLGFIIHGSYAFDKTIWFDDAAALESTSSSWSLQRGRWAYEAVNYLVRTFMGKELVASWHIINCFVIISLIALILFYRFRIEDRITRGALLVYMIVNITVLGNFGFVGSSAINFLGILTSTISAILVFDGIKDRRINNTVVGTLLLIVSIAMYQCYLAYFVTMVLVLFIDYILGDKEKSFGAYLGLGLIIIGIIIISLVLYFVTNSLVCRVANVELTDYAGISSYGLVGFADYLERIKYAYTEFFIQHRTNSCALFPFKWNWWYVFLVSLLVIQILSIVSLIQAKKYVKMIAFIVINALLPLAHNLVFVMYDKVSVHSLHMYQSIFIFFYAIILVKYLDKKIAKYVSVYMLFLILMFDILLIKYDNKCYVSIKLAKEQSEMYINRLLSDVHSTEGYVDGMAIFVVNMDDLEKKGIDRTNFHNDIYTNPFATTTLGYSRTEFINIYIDENIYLREIDPADYDYLGIYDMPKYPSYGSIKVVDDRVIVNL